MHYKYLFNLTTYLTVLLGIVAITGDYVVYHSKIHIFQALFDNVTHALIGGLSWFVVCVHYRSSTTFQTLLEVAACAFISSAIDLDHFVAAKSLRLKDATSLKGRPTLHCSTVPVAICAVLLLLSYLLQIPSLKRSTLIVLTAFVTHHTRDATRRGFYVYPYGSTPPIHYAVYVAITCFMPYLISTIYKYVKISNYSPNYDV